MERPADQRRNDVRTRRIDDVIERFRSSAVAMEQQYSRHCVRSAGQRGK